MADAYIVDARVLIQYFLTETNTPQVRVLIGGLARGDRLYVPEFGLLECVNILWRNVRFQGLPQTDGEQMIRDLLDLPLNIKPVSELLPRAFQIGLTHQLAIYDSLYIALALDLDCPLITVDVRQSQAAAASGVVLKAIADFSSVP
jgi:predicted nucleic acid-binding protein